MAKGRKHDKTGRSRGDKFVALRQGLRETPAWRSLSFAARCVLIEMMAGVHEANNGRVPRSVRFLADIVGASRSTIERALVDLQDRGFIVRTQAAYLGPDGHAQAALWRITEFGTPENSRPTKEYRDWRPPKSKSLSSKSGRSVPKIGTVAPEGVPKKRTGCPDNRDGKAGFQSSGCPEKKDESILPEERSVAPVPRTFATVRNGTVTRVGARIELPVVDVNQWRREADDPRNPDNWQQEKTP